MTHQPFGKHPLACCDARDSTNNIVDTQHVKGN